MDENRVFENNYEKGNFFLVPRALIDGTYPKDFLTHDELMLLLLIYAYRDTKHTIKDGKVTIGVACFDKHIRPIRSNNDKAKNILETMFQSLCRKQFIHPLHASDKANKFGIRYGISHPPLYDFTENKPIQLRAGGLFTLSEIKKTEITFIRIPKILIDENKITTRSKNYSLTINHLQVLLMLYRYNFLETYGGVSSSILSMQNGTSNIHDYVLKGLHIKTKSEKQEFDKILNELEQLGFVHYVDIVLKKGNYISDYKTYPKDKISDKHKIVTVVRPYYQPFFMKDGEKWV